MVNPSRPPLPPNRPYRQPLNYPDYVKDFDLDAYVRLFKVDIRANGETKDVKIVILFSLPLETMGLSNVTITWRLPKLYFL